MLWGKRKEEGLERTKKNYQVDNCPEEEIRREQKKIQEDDKGTKKSSC